MPNAIIAPYIQGQSPEIKLLLHDPRFARTPRLQFTREEIPELHLANTLFVPAGKWPARGWFLVSRADLNQLPNTYRTDFQLSIDDFLGGATVFKGLSIVQARNVTAGLLSDANAIYLVEMTDARGIVWNPWSFWPTSSQYNVPAPAYPGANYDLTDDIAGPWTWDRMVGNLWGQMASLIGPYPTLPIVVSGTPESFIFPGTSAWLSLCYVLEELGLTVAVDLTQDNPYTIVQKGSADANLDALFLKTKAKMEDNWDWIATGSGRVPKQVVVYFHRRNQYYGTEETVRGDNLQWTTTPLFSLTIAAPATFSNAAGTHFLWDDFTLRYDVDGNPLAADVATATTIANERVTQYYNKVYWGTLDSMRRTYAGLQPFTPGAQIDGVRFYMDFAAGRLGWRTEIIRGPDPPWPEVSVHEFGK